MWLAASEQPGLRRGPHALSLALGSQRNRTSGVLRAKRRPFARGSWCFINQGDARLTRPRGSEGPQTMGGRLLNRNRLVFHPTDCLVSGMRSLPRQNLPGAKVSSRVWRESLELCSLRLALPSTKAQRFSQVHLTIWFCGQAEIQGTDPSYCTALTTIPTPSGAQPLWRRSSFLLSVLS